MRSPLAPPIRHRDHFVETIQALSTDQDGLRNDWSHLLTSEPVENLAEHVMDIFVLCRTTPDLYGTVTVDAHLGAFRGVGGFDGTLGDADVLVTLQLEEGRLALAGRPRPFKEFFGALGTSAQSVTLGVIDRLAVEAELLALEHNDLFVV